MIYGDHFLQEAQQALQQGDKEQALKKLEAAKRAIQDEATFDLGAGRSRVLPWEVQGTALYNEEEPHTISVRRHKQKTPQLRLTDLRMSDEHSLAALEGKKVRVTVEIKEDN